MTPQIRLFVGNLPNTFDQNNLREEFSTFGEITNLELKSKPGENEEKKSFAFLTLCASQSNVESCIKYFSDTPFCGAKLYVTRARESFLERLQRERHEQEQSKQLKEKVGNFLPKENPVIRLGDKLTPKQKRNVNNVDPEINKRESYTRQANDYPPQKIIKLHTTTEKPEANVEVDQKKQDADKKRMESIRKKRQEFKEKQQLIKIGLNKIDQAKNKKVIFSDDEVSTNVENPKKKKLNPPNQGTKTTKSLFDDDDGTDDEVKFDIKEQYEGRKGQQVLEMQSRYKSDKRFVLDERFIDNDNEEQNLEESNDNIELGSADEKTKQFNILQDVLGIAITRSAGADASSNKIVKTKLGMLRFDPSQPDHAKYLAPVEVQQGPIKKQKKKKNQQEVEQKTAIESEAPRPEVSKEQFYKVSETLKETIAQPTTFSLRSLFGNTEEEQKTDKEPNQDYISLEMPNNQKKRVKNPLDPGERNPFVYDSSDSEDETKEIDTAETAVATTEMKAVWKENLFFTVSDCRLKDGLAFFNKIEENQLHKERRELKSLMKKRIYNKERKNQMFQRKIGGRKKSMKKSYRKKNYHK